MGLTGTTSWTASTKSNGTTIQRYKDDGTKVNDISYQGGSYFIYTSRGVLMYYMHVIFRVTTDAAGCSSLSFVSGGGRTGSSGPPKLYWKIQTNQSLSTSGGTEATLSGGWRGTMSNLKMLPNTDYYIHFWGTYGGDSGHVCRLNGTMTITGSGTYGEPGDIIAPDAVDFNDPIDMFFGSATDGGRYTVNVQVGDSDVVWAADTSYSEGDIVQYDGLLYKCLDDHVSEEGETPDVATDYWRKIAVTLQEYTESTIPAVATGTVESETITLDSINSELFKTAVDNESGTYEFSYFGTDWYLSEEIIDPDDYGMTIAGTPDEGDIITVDFTAEILGGAAKDLVWTPLLTEYANDNHTSATVPCLITVDTYFGTTLSGTRTKTVTVSFTAAQVGPEIDNTVFTITPKNVDVVSLFSGYIQNYSAIRASFDSSGVTLKYNATIVKWAVKFGSNIPIEITDGVTVIQDSNIISETTAVLLTLTDSRGFTASTTLTATIIPYQMPTFEATAIRCDGTGAADDAGSYCKVTLRAVYADVDSQNTLLPEAYIKLKSDQSYNTPIQITGGTTTLSDTNDIYEVTSFLIPGFLDRAYDVRLLITDGLQNTSALIFVIQSQAWALHLRNGGNGAAFGKVSERDNELDIGNWSFRCGSIIVNSTGAVLNLDNLVSKVTFYKTLIGQTSVTATVDGNITGATVDNAMFIAIVDKTFGTYIFSYDGRDWSLNGNTVDLENYGIEIEGIPLTGDTVEVVFASTGSWFEKNSTISISVSGDIEDATVDKSTFESRIAVTGTYVFSFDGTDWYYGSTVVDLVDYGIAITGTAADGDEITVVYTQPEYEDYPYRAAIPLAGVTAEMIPEVIFGLKEATSGYYAPISETYDGGVYLYASDDPAEAFLIPTIICWNE